MRPVPMAHTGSYAKIIREKSRSVNEAIAPSNCRAKTLSVRCCSRSLRLSPTQTMGVKPAPSAEKTRLLTVSVAFTKILTAFAVPHYDVGAAGSGDHGSGYFTGERALLFPIEVLGADFDVASLDGVDGSRQGRERRRDDNLAMSGVFHQRLEPAEELDRLGDRFEHLPVTREDGLSQGCRAVQQCA